MRRYDEPVEVRRGPVAGWPTEGPAQFLWRGRLWKVRAVVAHWVETGPWWQHAGARAVIGSEDAAPLPDLRPDLRADLTFDPGSAGAGSAGQGSAASGSAGSRAGGVLTALEDLLGERELWRVEAGRDLPDQDPRDPDRDPGAGLAGGTFDLAYDEADGRWQLVGCTD